MPVTYGNPFDEIVTTILDDLELEPETEYLSARMFSVEPKFEAAAEIYDYFSFGVMKASGGYTIGHSCNLIDRGRNVLSSERRTATILAAMKEACLTDKQANQIVKLGGLGGDLEEIQGFLREWKETVDKTLSTGESFLNPEIKNIPNFFGLETLEGVTTTVDTLNLTGAVNDIQDAIIKLKTQLSIATNRTAIPNVLVLPSNAEAALAKVLGVNRDTQLEEFVKDKLRLELIFNPYLKETNAFLYKKELVKRLVWDTPLIDAVPDSQFFVRFIAKSYIAGIKTNLPDAVLKIPLKIA